MRNFIVSFMLVILLSSLMFVILKPMHPAQIDNKSHEKSNVEKLLTEPSDKQANTYQEMSANQKKEIIDELLKQFEEKEKENSNTQTLPPPEEIPRTQKINLSQNNQSAPKNEINSDLGNNSIKNMQEELSKRYNNDPNAEISDEDVQNLLMQMLESIQKQ